MERGMDVRRASLPPFNIQNSTFNIAHRAWNSQELNNISELVGTIPPQSSLIPAEWRQGLPWHGGVLEEEKDFFDGRDDPARSSHFFQRRTKQMVSRRFSLRRKKVKWADQAESALPS
jgi:hypothetical protein